MYFYLKLEEVRGMQTGDAAAIIPETLDTNIIKNLDEVVPQLD